MKTIYISIILLLLFVSIGITGNITWVSTTETKPWIVKNISNSKDIDSKVYITLQPARTYQTIDGFGACFNELGWKVLSELSAKDRNEVVKALFDTKDGCKFNICRTPIGASDFAIDWYSLNEMPDDYEMNNFSIARDKVYLIPFIKSALKYQPNLKIWASSWSPPTWMKISNTYAGGNNRLKWEPQILNSYSLYLEKYVQAYKNEGINIYAIHVQNEPVANQVFPSCLWNGEQMREFVSDYLGPKFAQNNLKTQIWLSTLNDGNVNDFAVPVLKDPKANSYITGIGYQWSGKKAVAKTRELFPDKKIMATESECGNGSNDWAAAVHTFGLMLDYIGNGVNSYMYWNMILDDTGLSTWGWKQNSLISVLKANGKLRYNPEFFLMKHLSYYVVPGAKRISLTGTKDALAFKNLDGSLVLFLGNLTNDNITTRIQAGSQQPTIEIPAQSFNTIVIKP